MNYHNLIKRIIRGGTLLIAIALICMLLYLGRSIDYIVAIYVGILGIGGFFLIEIRDDPEPR